MSVELEHETEPSVGAADGRGVGDGTGRVVGRGVGWSVGLLEGSYTPHAAHDWSPHWSV